jgi:hypothetical protein
VQVTGALAKILKPPITQGLPPLSQRSSYTKIKNGYAIFNFKTLTGFVF